MHQVGDWVVTTACPERYQPHAFYIVQSTLSVYSHDIVLIHNKTGAKSSWRSALSFKRVCVFDIVYFKLEESYV